VRPASWGNAERSKVAEVNWLLRLPRTSMRRARLVEARAFQST
jgi:hypothetical protein